MNIENLEHLIRAAADITGQREFVIIGSQAILGQYPDAPAELLMSLEADIHPTREQGVGDAQQRSKRQDEEQSRLSTACPALPPRPGTAAGQGNRDVVHEGDQPDLGQCATNSAMTIVTAIWICTEQIARRRSNT